MALEWNAYAPETAAQDADAAKGDNGFLTLVSREEPFLLRIMPAMGSETSLFWVVWQHYWEFPDGSKFVFACPKLMERRYCEGCSRIERLFDTGAPTNKKMAKRFSPKLRVFSNALNREEPHKGARIFAFGKLLFEEMQKLRKNARRGDFTDPVGGYDFELYVSGEGFNRDYKLYPVPERSPLAATEQEMVELLNTKHDLNKYARLLTEQAILAGVAGGSVALAQGRTAPREEPRMDNRATTRVLEARTPAAPRGNPAATTTAPPRRGSVDDEDSPF